MRLRAFTGFRFWVGYFGAMTATFGTVLFGCWQLRREPSPSAHATDPALRGVRYEVPRWLLEVGRGLVGLGVMLVAVAWLSSPRWEPGRSGPVLGQRATTPLFALFVASVVAAIVLGLAAGDWGRRR